MEIVVIVHNIRSILNVGAIFRSSEGFGVKKIWLSGYTPNPKSGLPHTRQKLADKLHKTALGTENLVDFDYDTSVVKITTLLREQGFRIVGLEQAARSILLPNYRPSSDKIALLLGEETAGLTPELLAICDDIIEIPMFGQKESFNVSVAAGIALYHFATTQSAS
ncbi:MAG: TrmH family RNA methyltransferase [Candidatus Nomurabacteria bacterium]|jgi:tRNA G18 (ribose-2'-O)-methylase SpoU|nr:TrmH family RNA methyltransferase [Candidatus Nomurabacteria bacterium]